MPLSDLLRAEIAARGPIPFRDFMERSLYDPEHGYYTAGRAEIGRKGDFFTSVSVGPLFGRLLARQFVEMWELLGCPAPFSIVEQGAHRGDLAQDVLSGLRESAPDTFAALTYRIVEPMKSLATAQREKLREFSERTDWSPSLDALPAFTGVHFSNELVDAFPVPLVRWTGDDWLERHVAVKGAGFTFTDLPLTSPRLRDRLATLPTVPEGYVSEVNLAALDWLSSVAARLTRGFVLTVDYGYPRDLYYAPHRIEGTLSAYAAHQRERDPLARPGELDLTAHVDFTSLAERGLALGLDLAGFTDQHHFLVGLSPLHFADEAPSPEALRQFKTLMHPEMMGRRFHALCLSRGVAGAAPLAGFTYAREPRAALGLEESK